jgi:membrane-bound lytic murein transglycosylase D
VGFTLLVPSVTPQDTPQNELVTVVVPSVQFTYADRRRIFYRPTGGESLTEVSKTFGVTASEICEWNQIDPEATLQPGMTLQLFVATDLALAGVIVLEETAVRVLVVGTEEFFDYHEGQRGRARVRYVVQSGDTLASIARRFELEIGDLTRINRFSPKKELRSGEEIIVYTTPTSARTQTVEPISDSLPNPPVVPSETEPSPSGTPKDPAADPPLENHYPTNVNQLSSY